MNFLLQNVCQHRHGMNLQTLNRAFFQQNVKFVTKDQKLLMRTVARFLKRRKISINGERFGKYKQLSKKLLACGTSLATINLLNLSKNLKVFCAEPEYVAQSEINEKTEPETTSYKQWYDFFIKYILPQIFPLLLAIASAFGASFINIQIPQLLGELVNLLSRQINSNLSFADYVNIFQDSSSKLLLYYLCQGALTFICISLLSNVGERIACEMRKDLFLSLLKQDIAFYDVHKTGELIDRLTSDVQDFKSSFKVCVSQGLRSSSQTIGCIFSLYKISPKLTMLMAIVIPGLVIIGALMGAYLRHYSRKAQDQMAYATSFANEAIGNVRTVRAFAMETTEFEAYSAEIEKAKDYNQALGIGIGAFQGMTNIALNGIVLGMIYCGGFLVSSYGMQPGELMSFLVASQMIQRSLASLSVLFGSAIRGAEAASRVMEYIELKPEMSLTGGWKIPHYSLIGEVEFHNVRFSYPSRPDCLVLKDISLKLPPCKVIALCGLSGGGKSTVASLIERFYDPTAGKITLDGKDLKKLDPSWLREKVIGYISQEPVLFNTTIAENIRYGKPDATDAEIMEAAKLANAEQFISNFPNGYDTIVGERGLSLSGGQKQRIAIARALIKNPAILILDEATSALDAESERLVQEALDHVMVGRTVLVIAHRLSTIQNADIIAVVSNGQIAEIGSHFELLRSGRIYRELIRRQAMLK
uniref:mitochondrial potassium channel ATP-binding subunit-like n=1 Tax=Styela clava TaxID=7725 RepID=UPI0019399945|nr:mitochondrial potassium channel ATP-binding subunit-like [Styela clava]